MPQKGEQSVETLVMYWCSIQEVGLFSDNLVGMRAKKALAITINEEEAPCVGECVLS